MDRDTKTDIFKIIMTGLFVVISYLIANKVQVTRYILSFSVESWHTTVSVAIYTTILNACLTFFLSKRTEILVDIKDKQNESYSMRLGDRPGVIIIDVTIKGNLKKINNNIIIEFPKWIDPMVKGSPDISQSEDNQYKYIIDLSDTPELGKYASKKFSISIVKNNIYNESNRKNEVAALISGSRIRYSKEIKKMVIFSNEEIENV